MTQYLIVNTWADFIAALQAIGIDTGNWTGSNIFENEYIAIHWIGLIYDQLTAEPINGHLHVNVLVKSDTWQLPELAGATTINPENPFYTFFL